MITARPDVDDDVRARVSSVVVDYAHGVDAQDWELVRRCFHDDAVDRHEGHTAPVDEFVGWVVRRHRAVVSAMHMVTTVRVTGRTPDQVRAESYCRLYQGMSADCQETLDAYGLGQRSQLPVQAVCGRAAGTVVELTGLCRYHDTFEEREGKGWRIASRQVSFVTLRATQGELPN